jgi:predicted nucleic-acid-binding protein
MIGLDTNILARYYVEDESDQESLKQRIAARLLMEGGETLQVCKTVLLEFEWVMRGYYGIDRQGVIKVFSHLLGLPHVVIEDRPVVEAAMQSLRDGFDFADALHHASYGACRSVMTFDDKKFARRARRKNWVPVVQVPDSGE